jgi:DNA-binding transcriptional MerR regulator
MSTAPTFPRTVKRVPPSSRTRQRRAGEHRRSQVSGLVAEGAPSEVGVTAGAQEPLKRSPRWKDDDEDRGAGDAVGRSVHTIRYYESQRLMPNVTRDQGGRRLYTEWHVAWLDFLARLRQSGMAIADMRAYTALVADGDATLPQRRTFLRAHRAKVASAIAELEQCLALIDRKIALYGRWMKADGSASRRRRTGRPSGGVG